MLVEVALDQMPPGAKTAFRHGRCFDGVVPLRPERVLTLLVKPFASWPPD